MRYARNVALCAATLAACDQPAPLAPLDEPQFLLGSSPLAPIFQPVVDPTTGIMLGGTIGVTVEVTKGLTKVGDADRFLLRTGVSFTDPGSGRLVGAIAPKDDVVATSDPKDGALRRGSMVPVAIEVPLSDAMWLAVLTQPDAVTAEADIVLINIGVGERELDGVVTAGAIDPKSGPVLAPAGSPKLETEWIGDLVVRKLSIALHVPTLLTGPVPGGAVSYTAGAAFSLGGTPLAVADPRPSSVSAVDPEDGGVALVVIALPLDEATWAAIDAATTEPGDLVDVALEVAIVFTPAGGGEVVLGMGSLASTIDPKTDGVPPSKDENDGGKS